MTRSDHDNITTMLLVLHFNDGAYALTERAAVEIVFGVQGRKRPPSNWVGGGSRGRKQGYWQHVWVVRGGRAQALPRVQITEKGRQRLYEATSPQAWDSSLFDPTVWLKHPERYEIRPGDELVEKHPYYSANLDDLVRGLPETGEELSAWLDYQDPRRSLSDKVEWVLFHAIDGGAVDDREAWERAIEEAGGLRHLLRRRRTRP